MLLIGHTANGKKFLLLTFIDWGNRGDHCLTTISVLIRRDTEIADIARTSSFLSIFPDVDCFGICCNRYNYVLRFAIVRRRLCKLRRSPPTFISHPTNGRLRLTPPPATTEHPNIQPKHNFQLWFRKFNDFLSGHVQVQFIVQCAMRYQIG